NSSNAVVRQAFGGWQLSGITSMFTGEPMDFNCGVDGYSTGIAAATATGSSPTSVRCNTVGALKIKKSTYNDPTFGPMVRWFDPSVLTQPLQSQLLANGQPGMFGYMGRNALTGPGRNNWDLALHKDFALPWFRGEHSTLQFRVETFNTFNHPQWRYISASCGGAPNADGSPAFGRTCGGGPHHARQGAGSRARGPRNIPMGGEVIFFRRSRA